MLDHQDTSPCNCRAHQREVARDLRAAFRGAFEPHGLKIIGLPSAIELDWGGDACLSERVEVREGGRAIAVGTVDLRVSVDDDHECPRCRGQRGGISHVHLRGYTLADSSGSGFRNGDDRLEHLEGAQDIDALARDIAEQAGEMAQ